MSVTTEVFGIPRPGSYRIYYIMTKSETLATALAASEKNPVVLMFWANRNEPCKVMMRPFWDVAMAKKKDAVFIRVDADKCRDIAELYRVEALPTFLLIKERSEKARVVGAKVDELNTVIKGSIYANILI